MRALALLLLAAAASAAKLPHQPEASSSGHSSAQVTTHSAQQTGGDIASLSDAELLAALTGELGPQQPSQPAVQQPHSGAVHPDQPPTKIVEPVTPPPQPETTTLSDAQLLASLGIGAGQGEPVKCSGSQYFCVPYYQCHEDEIITDGAGLIDIRFGSKANESEPLSHSECPSFLDVCCRDPTAKPDPIPEPVYEPRCGRRNEFGVNARITGFTDGESQFGEIPWMAAVLRVEQVGEESKNLFVCGGALIHPQVVMTAAHCVARQLDQRLKVRLGEWDTQHTTEFYPHEDVDVKHVDIHEEYNGRNLHNDMALLFLEKPVKLQEHIDTLCLPEPGVDYTGAECLVTGWGKDRFDGGQYQTVLKQVGLQRVDHGYCQDQLRTTRLGQRFELDESFTCGGAPPAKEGELQAEGPAADACTGDGGSPMACRDPADPDRYVHGGVVAWGIGCGERGIPGVYADPQKFLYWIDEHVTQHLNLKTPYWGYATVEPAKVAEQAEAALP